MLRPHNDTRISLHWDGEPCDLMIALHARRSADSIARWAESHPERPLVVVLTGTDLYRDIATDASAQRSLALAHRLVVLQELGPRAVPAEHRGKCEVIYQSSTARRALARTDRHLRALMVGHLRGEKSPQTWFEAARLLAGREDILLDHVGGPLDPALGAEAERLSGELAGYRWLGALPHGRTLRHIQRAHLLVHASVMEGGAHVIIEAVRSGTPVLASRIDGNVGMLGEHYAGYFRTGDAPELARLLVDCRDSQSGRNDLLDRLRAQCRQRDPLFAPERERSALLGLVDRLLEKP